MTNLFLSASSLIKFCSKSMELQLTSKNPLIYTGVLLQYILFCVNALISGRRTCGSCVYGNTPCLDLLECQPWSLVLSTTEPIRREDRILGRRGLHIRNNKWLLLSNMFSKVLLLRLEFWQWGSQYMLESHRAMSWNRLNKCPFFYDIFPDSSSKDDLLLLLPPFSLILLAHFSFL